tara:strand:- start:297 stop:551 length:255 start_codon:yes stop_codon:yes gene_type:complete
MKINKKAIQEAIGETREEIKDIQHGINRDQDNSRDTVVGDRIGLQGRLDRNRQWIELGIIIALYCTGSPVLATLMLALYVVDTM